MVSMFPPALSPTPNKNHSESIKDACVKGASNHQKSYRPGPGRNLQTLGFLVIGHESHLKPSESLNPRGGVVATRNGDQQCF